MPMRCLAAIQRLSDATTELGGWTGGACVAAALYCWSRLEAGDANAAPVSSSKGQRNAAASSCEQYMRLGKERLSTRAITILLCAAAICGPATRLAINEAGGGFHWYWRSVYGLPKTGRALFESVGNASDFLLEQSRGLSPSAGLSAEEIAEVVQTAKAAALHLLVELHPTRRPTATELVPPQQVQLLAESIMAVECLFGGLRAARWSLSTATPMSCWSAPDSHSIDVSRGALTLGDYAYVNMATTEPLSLFTLLRCWLIYVKHGAKLQHDSLVSTVTGLHDTLVLLKAAGEGDRKAARMAVSALLLQAELHWASMVSALPPGLFAYYAHPDAAWLRGFDLDLPKEWKTLSTDL